MVALAVLGATACSSDTSGIDATDLVGEWSSIDGRSVGARAGTPDESNHASEAGDFIFPDDALLSDWTLRITEARDRGFLGEWCSPKQCEPLAGAVRQDGTAIMTDEDSVFTLTRDGDELELCVASPESEFQIAACHVMQRG